MYSLQLVPTLALHRAMVRASHRRRLEYLAMQHHASYSLSCCEVTTCACPVQHSCEPPLTLWQYLLRPMSHSIMLSRGQPLSNSQRRISRWPLRAAASQASSSHSHCAALSHWQMCRWPHCAAFSIASFPKATPCCCSHSNTCRAPTAAAFAAVLALTAQPRLCNHRNCSRSVEQAAALSHLVEPAQLVNAARLCSSLHQRL
jgi:hypothetical protein